MKRERRSAGSGFLLRIAASGGELLCLFRKALPFARECEPCRLGFGVRSLSCVSQALLSHLAIRVRVFGKHREPKIQNLGQLFQQLRTSGDWGRTVPAAFDSLSRIATSRKGREIAPAMSA